MLDTRITETDALYDSSNAMLAAPQIDLAGVSPTLLPDLLRALSRQAGRLANDPFNVLDDNPFIMREWSTVSQVLHSAAMAMEQRFELLFGAA